MLISGTGNTVGGTVAAARNVMSGNLGDGLSVDSGTLVVGNYIGTDSSGNALSASQQVDGIEVIGSSDTIGGTTAAASNVISGNGQGVLIDSGASLILIEGNDIGTNPDGTAKVPNAAGVIIGGLNNTIGGAAAGAGNLVGGNIDGIEVESTGNVILGNLIGTNGSGANLGNGLGISVDAANNTVGGTVAGAA